MPLRNVPRFQPVIQEFGCISKEESKNVRCCFITKFTVPSRMWVCLCCFCNITHYSLHKRNETLCSFTEHSKCGARQSTSALRISNVLCYTLTTELEDCHKVCVLPDSPKTPRALSTFHCMSVCVYVCVANMPWHVCEYALLT